MAMAKNKHGYDVIVDFGRGPELVKDGELVQVPDEYFVSHVVPDETWEVRGKPEDAALSVEELQAQEAESESEAPAEDQAVVEAQAADEAAQAELAAQWEAAAPALEPRLLDYEKPDLPADLPREESL